MIDETDLYALQGTIRELIAEIKKLREEINDLRITVRDDINSR